MKAGVIVSSLFAATAGQHSLSQNGWQQQSVSVADRNAAQSAQSIVNTIIAALTARRHQSHIIHR